MSKYINPTVYALVYQQHSRLFHTEIPHQARQAILLHLQSHSLELYSVIITNEKIKVMLSRKRCRGTLQDYKKGEISKCQSKLWTNRNVFRWCLNGTREKTVRRDDGRLFHARGAATGKARSPRVDLCTSGTTSVVVVDDRL